MANEVKERRWLAAIFSLYFLLGIGYSLLMPIWEAPDEPAHYHVAWRFARDNKFPTEEQNYEVVQPHAYYFFSSYVIRALEKIEPRYTNYFHPKEYKYNIRVAERRFDWNDNNYRFMLGVYALRWINIVLGALALWTGWKTFLLIVPNKPALRLGALALAAFTPQYLHIMSSVSNDALGTLAGAFLFYLAMRVIKEQNNLLALLSIVLVTLLPLVTKLTVLPVSAALLVIVAGKWFFGLRQKQWLVIAGLVFLFSLGIFYFLFPEAFEWTQKEITWRLFSLRKKGVDFDYIKTITSQIVWTYWGKVGWIAVGLPWWVIDLLTAVALFGIAAQIYKIIKSKTNYPQFNYWIATTMIALFTILAVGRNGLTTGATQGRFLFPAIGALSLLMVSGWHGVLPERVQKKFPLIVVIVMSILNISLWAFGIIPIYYQPFLD
ncbi:MAG: hypothetical protein L0287_00595 [Anaerolineae bacterium]|nr:hypothetical protein [Anaerolineae bacterium]